MVDWKQLVEGWIYPTLDAVLALELREVGDLVILELGTVVFEFFLQIIILIFQLVQKPF